MFAAVASGDSQHGPFSVFWLTVRLRALNQYVCSYALCETQKCWPKHLSNQRFFTYFHFGLNSYVEPFIFAQKYSTIKRANNFGPRVNMIVAWYKTCGSVIVHYDPANGLWTNGNFHQKFIPVCMIQANQILLFEFKVSTILFGLLKK